MKYRISPLSLIIFCLCGIIAVSTLIFDYAQAQAKKPPKPTVAAPPPTAAKTTSPTDHKVVAYYFHTSYRCWTCKQIEALTKEAIQNNFAQELKTGRLEWQSVNIDEPANQHFVQDYKLYTKSVIIADFQNGKQVRWKNLEKVWECVHNPGVFANYIRMEVSAYLGKR